jgi:hypothetical protein
MQLVYKTTLTWWKDNEKIILMWHPSLNNIWAPMGPELDCKRTFSVENSLTSLQRFRPGEVTPLSS